MDLSEARRFAEQSMREMGLEDWTIRWDRSRRRAGQCRYHEKVISFSRPLLELYDEAAVREVVAHELAHALVGPGVGHGPAWKAMARALGSNGSATLPASLPRPPATWVGLCPTGHRFERYRRPKSAASCSRCAPGFNANFLIEWSRPEAR